MQETSNNHPYITIIPATSYRALAGMMFLSFHMLCQPLRVAARIPKGYYFYDVVHNGVDNLVVWLDD